MTRETEINIVDCGGEPDSHRNVVPAVLKAIKKAKSRPGSAIVFPKGRYDFWPEGMVEMELSVSNNENKGLKKVAFPMIKLRGIEIDGRGSRFVFHGEVMPFEIQDSVEISLRNFSIDWERPTMSQATIIDIGKSYFDLEFLRESTYAIRDERIHFYGEGWKGGAWGAQPHDGKTGRLKYRHTSGLNFDLKITKTRAKELRPGVVRVYGRLRDNFNVFDVLHWRHLDRNNVGIHVYRSSHTCIEKVDMHYACAMGVVGQRSDTITLDGFRILVPKGSARRFTTYADATHFSGCKGLIRVQNCYFEHMLDDAINVHGTYVRVSRKTGPKKLLVKFMHGQSKGMDIAARGDLLSLIDNESMLSYTTLTVQSFRLKSVWEAEICFKETLPERLKVGDGLENLTWTPEVIFRNNKIIHNRARGMLFNSARKTVVENNYVQTAGSALLVAGDCNGWYESGPVGLYGPLVIRNNTFDNCLTTLYQFTHAQISIDPIIPKLTAGDECYHRTIQIEKNHFKVFDAPLLFARSVDGLKFCKNTLERTRAFKPYHWNEDAIRLENCRNVSLTGNVIKGKLCSTSIKLEKMTSEECRGTL